MIFDNLNIPARQRTIALSFYEHPNEREPGGIHAEDVGFHFIGGGCIGAFMRIPSTG
jgi:hypothetical protein